MKMELRVLAALKVLMSLEFGERKPTTKMASQVFG